MQGDVMKNTNMDQVPQDIKNTLMDREQERERMAYEKSQIQENEAPRKSMMETIKKAMDKVSSKPVKKASGGSINASKRADGCAQRGKTRGRII